MAGVLVHADPARAAAVADFIAGLPGAAVHAAGANGKLVVTLESEHSTGILDQLTTIQRYPAVLSAVLVSEHSEPIDTVDQEITHDG